MTQVPNAVRKPRQAQIPQLVNVTTSSGQRRHFLAPGGGYTLCHNVAVTPTYPARGYFTQAEIDAMPLCVHCARKAGADH